MRPRFVRARYAYVRVDNLSAVIVPVVAMAVAILAGQMILAVGLTKSIYSSPFVALCALVSNRVCLRAGLLTALLSMLGHEFFFSAPYWHLDWPNPEQSLAYAANFLAAVAVARRCPLPPERPAAPPSDQILPFVDTPAAPHGKNFWFVQGGGDFLEDCDVGGEYARLYMDQRIVPGPCPALAWIVRDMARSGRWTGVEVGFLSSIEAAAARGHALRRSDLSFPDHNPDNLDVYRSIIKP